jgi:hypothetical protein
MFVAVLLKTVLTTQNWWLVMATGRDYGLISFAIKSPATSVRVPIDCVPKGGTSLSLIKLELCIIVVFTETFFTEFN